MVFLTGCIMIWMTFENMANWVKKGQGFFCFRPPQKQTRQQKTFSHASPPYRKITVKMQHWKLVALMETSTSDIFWALLRIHGNQVLIFIEKLTYKNSL